MMSVDEMLVYRVTIVKNLEEVVQDLDVLRVDDEAAARAIDHLSGQIDKVVEERRKLAHDIQLLQVRLDDGTTLIHRDNGDLKYELNQQKTFLGLKVIEKALKKVMRNRKVDHFSFLVTQIQQDDQQIGSILAFRRFCIRYRRRRQQKYFELWITRGMRPMSLIRQNRGATAFQ